MQHPKFPSHEVICTSVQRAKLWLRDFFDKNTSDNEGKETEDRKPVFPLVLKKIKTPSLPSGRSTENISLFTMPSKQQKDEAELFYELGHTAFTSFFQRNITRVQILTKAKEEIEKLERDGKELEMSKAGLLKKRAKLFDDFTKSLNGLPVAKKKVAVLELKERLRGVQDNRDNGADEETPSVRIKTESNNDTSSTPYTDVTGIKTIRPDGSILRPMNAFMLWAKERRVEMISKGMSVSQVSQELSEQWKAMSEEEKGKFYRDAEHLKSLHRLQHPDYKYSPHIVRNTTTAPSPSREDSPQVVPNQPPDRSAKDPQPQLSNMGRETQIHPSSIRRESYIQASNIGHEPHVQPSNVGHEIKHSNLGHESHIKLSNVEHEQQPSSVSRELPTSNMGREPHIQPSNMGRIQVPKPLPQLRNQSIIISKPKPSQRPTPGLIPVQKLAPKPREFEVLNIPSVSSSPRPNIKITSTFTPHSVSNVRRVSGEQDLVRRNQQELVRLDHGQNMVIQKQHKKDESRTCQEQKDIIVSKDQQGGLLMHPKEMQVMNDGGEQVVIVDQDQRMMIEQQQDQEVSEREEQATTFLREDPFSEQGTLNMMDIPQDAADVLGLAVQSSGLEEDQQQQKQQLLPQSQPQQLTPSPPQQLVQSQSQQLLLHQKQLQQSQTQQLLQQQQQLLQERQDQLSQQQQHQELPLQELPQKQLEQQQLSQSQQFVIEGGEASQQEQQFIQIGGDNYQLVDDNQEVEEEEEPVFVDEHGRQVFLSPEQQQLLREQQQLIDHDHPMELIDQEHLGQEHDQQIQLIGQEQDQQVQLVGQEHDQQVQLVGQEHLQRVLEEQMLQQNDQQPVFVDEEGRQISLTPEQQLMLQNQHLMLEGQQLMMDEGGQPVLITYQQSDEDVMTID